MRLFWHFSEDSAVGDYRVWIPNKYMSRIQGVLVNSTGGMRQVKYDEPNDDMGMSLRAAIKNAEICVFQRVDSFKNMSLIHAIQKEYKKPVVLDLDDNFLDIDRHHPLYDVYREKSHSEIFKTAKVPIISIPKIPKELFVMAEKDPYEIGTAWVVTLKYIAAGAGMVSRKLAKEVHAITTTQSFLADVYKKYRGDDNVHVIPNTLDYEIWDKLPPHKTNDDKIIIGWAGGAQHEHDLRIVISAVENILRKYPNVEFHWAGIDTKETNWMCGKFPNQTKKLDRVTIQKWPEGFASWNFDINLAPLWASPFTNSKSNIKWLEGSARKIPTIASKMEAYKAIVHGETGMLVDESASSWTAAMEELINDRTKRIKIGQNAYEDSKAKYDPTYWAQKRYELYQRIIDKRLKELNPIHFAEMDGKPIEIEEKGNSKVVYTAITGGYDKPVEQELKPGWDYVIFTDRKDVISKTGKVIYIDPKGDSKKDREIKWLPHKYLPDYDAWLWLDGNIKLNKDPDDLLAEMDVNGVEAVFMKHFERDCIYVEAEACKIYKKDEVGVIDAQVKFLRGKNYPEHNGLVAGGVIMRKNTRAVKIFCDKVFEVVKKYSRRDQLAINYVAWKRNYKFGTIDWQVGSNEDAEFYMVPHKKN